MARQTKAPKREPGRKRKASVKSPVRKTPVRKAVVSKASARKAGLVKRTSSRPATGGAAGAGASVRIRFYCQGIGDCHLLRFAKPDGDAFWMLIDCGVHSSVIGGTDKIKDIVADIRKLTPRLDVIALTHEHWDHNSGFFSEHDAFKNFEVGEVWLGWTENAADPQARELDKFKGAAIQALQGASRLLERAQGLSSYLANVQQGLHAVLEFNLGAKGEKVRAARDAAIKLAPSSDKVRFLEPKDSPFELPVAPRIRVYVLGPPRDKALIGVTDRPGETYGINHFGLAPIVLGLNNAFDSSDDSCNDETAPFDPNEGFDLDEILAGTDAPAQFTNKEELKARARTLELMRARYTDAAGEPWRRIDHDWLGVSADLAIQIDQRTNNSSLVLAFEFLDTGRVMLFVGDAQVGNWLSWKDVHWPVGDKTVSAHDLLARTVFYKVGHHGSHNATLKQNGLELMTNPDLAAFIPTNAADAKKVGWGEMPFEPLLDDLKKRTSQRVVRADDPWLKQAADPANLAKGSIKKVSHDQSGRGLWVEFEIG
jgi:beta-lactamase superfamily II metal-dependent hydrolase